MLFTDINDFWITDALAESTILNAWIINGTNGLQERQGSATPVFSVDASGNLTAVAARGGKGFRVEILDPVPLLQRSPHLDVAVREDSDSHDGGD
jgi:hypothetical protein